MHHLVHVLLEIILRRRMRKGGVAAEMVSGPVYHIIQNALAPKLCV
jgi:hypothetical protein